MAGGQLTIIVSGAVIIENIFGLPGLGQLLTNATSNRDYTVVSAVVLITAVVLVFINLLTDLSYGFLDPRVHYR
jgi:peptide/nickel transport system permease protein